jgi:hypothetical protein
MWPKIQRPECSHILRGRALPSTASFIEESFPSTHVHVSCNWVFFKHGEGCGAVKWLKHFCTEFIPSDKSPEVPNEVDTF